jgi:RNA polymerase sigma-70 factor (ECF subfamily)
MSKPAEPVRLGNRPSARFPFRDSDFFRPSGVLPNGDPLLLRIVEDRELVERARRGDVESYNVLVSRWEKKLYNYLLRLTRNREDALDLSQEAFFKAYRSLETLEDAGKFASWLYRIAHNQAFTKFRGDSRRKEDPVDLTASPNQPRTGESVGLPSIGLGGRRVYPQELELIVERALDALSEEQREAILLKVYQGFQIDEIAEILSCPLSTVKSRIYSGMELMKQHLLEQGTRNDELRTSKIRNIRPGS